MSAMCPDAPDRLLAGKQRRGFALPTAIFLMVILALLGAFIVRITSMQSGSVTLDVLGSGAYQAARAGTEWGAFQALRVIGPDPAPCFGSTDITFAGTSLAAFTATVTCARTTANELGVTRTFDQITSTACNQPPCPNTGPTLANYTERRITIMVGQ
jgi:MSHA biogenesis protein MshP